MSNGEIRSICERIARLEQQRKELLADINEIKKQAADDGYDKKLITKTVRLLLLSPKKRQAELEEHELADTYFAASGLLQAFEANVAAKSKAVGRSGEAAGIASTSPDAPACYPGTGAHDPETGEIESVQPVRASSPATAAAGGVHGVAPPAIPIHPAIHRSGGAGGALPTAPPQSAPPATLSVPWRGVVQ